MSVKNRVLEYISEAGLRKSRFEKQAGLSNGYLNSVKGNIGSDKLENILRAFPDINREWLLTGEGEMLKSDSLKSDGQIIYDSQLVMVPLVGKFAYAGYACGYADDEYVETLPRTPFINTDGLTHKGEYVAFEVRGDSMDDGSINSIAEGDILLCRVIQPHFWRDSKLHLKKWNFVIVTDEGILVKRIVDHDVRNHTITIHSLNEMYPDQVIGLANVKQLLNVVEQKRRPIL